MDPQAVDQSIMSLLMDQQPQIQGGGSGQLNNLYKTQLCKHYMQTKQCHVGKRCHFAHGDIELRKREEPLPVEVTLRMMNIPYNNFKTQTCKNYEKEGKCKFGEKCSYAHGKVDLRNPYDNIIMPPEGINPIPTTNFIAPSTPKQNTQQQNSNSVQAQHLQFEHQLQQINNYSFNPQPPQEIQSQSPPLSIQLKNNYFYDQRMHAQSLSPTHRQFIQVPPNQGLNIQPQKMFVQNNQQQLYQQQNMMPPTMIQRHMSDNQLHALMHNQYNHPVQMQNMSPQMIGMNQQTMMNGNIHMKNQIPIQQQSPVHNYMNQNYQASQHIPNFSHQVNMMTHQNSFMISPRQISTADMSPMEPLRHKSLSLDNSLSWNSSQQTNSRSATQYQHQMSGGFTSTSVNTGLVNGSSGNGFNYMLINPAIYDEDNVIEEQTEDSIINHKSLFQNPLNVNANGYPAQFDSLTLHQ